MNALVIGGTGFIGPHVIRALVEQGRQVTVLHRGVTQTILPAGVKYLYGDVVNLSPASDFDAVIHMIAMGERDARTAVEAFRGRTDRIVWLSSGDVYRAYGRFIGIEPGPLETGLLCEESPLRSVLFPYRAKPLYEKILVEKIALDEAAPPGVVLRLPKVYGPGGNADLATVYRYRHHPNWRWTHGYVENVAWAIALAASHPAAPGRVYNVGEEITPTVAERLASLPASDLEPDLDSPFNSAQDIAYDTSRIRRELGFFEPVSYPESIFRTLRTN